MTQELPQEIKTIYHWFKRFILNGNDNHFHIATLKRCKSVRDVVKTSVYAELYADFVRVNPDADTSTLPIVAGVLAHVTKANNMPLGKQMATLKATPLGVSTSRFGRLTDIPNAEGDMAIDDANDLLETMSDIIDRMGGTANVIELIETIYRWDDDSRTKLMRSYYYNNKTD
jgi:CRISPR-associated protein Cse2 (CRISPR_cse2)